MIKSTLIPLPQGFSTTFPLTENPISESGAWFKHSSNSRTVVRTSGGFAFGTQDGSGAADDSYAYLQNWVGNDYRITGVLKLDAGAVAGATTGHEVELHARVSDSATEARVYEWLIGYSNSGLYTQINRWNGPADDFSFLETGSLSGLNDGDEFELTMQGTTMTCKQNGSTIMTRLGVTFANGKPGMGAFVGIGGAGTNSEVGWKSISVVSL